MAFLGRREVLPDDGGIGNGVNLLEKVGNKDRVMKMINCLSGLPFVRSTGSKSFLMDFTAFRLVFCFPKRHVLGRLLREQTPSLTFS